MFPSCWSRDWTRGDQVFWHNHHPGYPATCTQISQPSRGVCFSDCVHVATCSQIYRDLLHESHVSCFYHTWTVSSVVTGVAVMNLVTRVMTRACRDLKQVEHVNISVSGCKLLSRSRAGDSANILASLVAMWYIDWSWLCAVINLFMSCDTRTQE